MNVYNFEKRLSGFSTKVTCEILLRKHYESYYNFNPGQVTITSTLLMR